MSEKEFGDFYVKYLKTIKRWLRQYFSVEADVEDTAHDIFIRV
jgi:DNA-directed RNA polymerase specialized sigma24 family protein